MFEEPSAFGVYPFPTGPSERYQLRKSSLPTPLSPPSYKGKTEQVKVAFWGGMQCSKERLLVNFIFEMKVSVCCFSSPLENLGVPDN